MSIPAPPENMEIRWKPNDAVNPIWRNAALLLAGIVLAGIPAYGTLALNLHGQMTKADVDSEIESRNLALVQSVTDLKEQVTTLEGKVDKLADFERSK